jgi:hypothetical protein
MNSDYFLNIFTQELFNRIYVGKYTIHIFVLKYLVQKKIKIQWKKNACIILLTKKKNPEKILKTTIYRLWLLYNIVILWRCLENLHLGIPSTHTYQIHSIDMCRPWITKCTNVKRTSSFNISSSCDVVYKGRWLTQAGYWFILRFCEHFTCYSQFFNYLLYAKSK